MITGDAIIDCLACFLISLANGAAFWPSPKNSIQPLESIKTLCVVTQAPLCDALEHALRLFYWAHLYKLYRISLFKDDYLIARPQFQRFARPLGYHNLVL